MIKLLRLLAFFSILILVSCSTSNKKPQKVEGTDIRLESCSWSLKELNGNPVVRIAGGKEIYLDFSKGDNLMQGSGGCNTMNGMYTVHDDLIKLHSMMRTETACIDESMNKQEALFFQLIEETDRYKIRGNKEATLELYKDKQLLMILLEDSLKK